MPGTIDLVYLRSLAGEVMTRIDITKVRPLALASCASRSPLGMLFF